LFTNQSVRGYGPTAFLLASLLACHHPAHVSETSERGAIPSCIEDCRALGACTLIDDQCRVVDDEDCKQSRVCSRFGECVKRGDECQANSPKRCLESDDCTRLGLCTLVNHHCAATKIRDCEKSIVACERDGECGLGKGRCIAIREKDCKLSSNCIDLGICFLKEDRCTAKE
jgi:hypothetical protein